MKKNYSAICLITKDENIYLPEWIRHHLNIGFDHIYIYDHNNTVPIQETVDTRLKRKERESVTVIDWRGKHEHAQDEAYMHCLETFRDETEWMAFIDTDEFIIIKQDSCINDFLKRYENQGGVYINWLMYNANDREKQEQGGVMERFTQTCDDPMNYGKLICRTDVTRKNYIHTAEYIDGFQTVDELGNVVNGRSNPYHTDYIQCNHYYTKSWEEWKKKIFRGVADPLFSRHLKDFFVYNPDMKYLDTGEDFEQTYEKQ